MAVFAGKGRKPRKAKFLGESPKSLSRKKRRNLVRRISHELKGKPTGFMPEIERTIAKTSKLLNKTSFFIERNGLKLKSEKRVRQAQKGFELILSTSLRKLLNSTPLHERRRLLKRFVTAMNELEALAENNFADSKTAGIIAFKNLNLVKREEAKIIKRIVLNGTKAIKKKCRKYYKELPAEARKASTLEPFRSKALKHVFDYPFAIFNKELALRKNRFFVSRGNLRLVNQAEVRAFKADIVQLFLDELWLNLQETPKKQRVAFLKGIEAYANEFPVIGQRKSAEKLHALGSSKAIEAERIQTLKIAMTVWNTVAKALKQEASIELQNLKSGKNRKRK